MYHETLNHCILTEYLVGLPHHLHIKHYVLYNADGTFKECSNLSTFRKCCENSDPYIAVIMCCTCMPRLSRFAFCRLRVEVTSSMN